MTNLAFFLFLTTSSLATATPACKTLLLTEQDFGRHRVAITRKVTSCWRLRRCELGITQAAVARALGIAQGTFSNRINGATRYQWSEDDLRNLARALEIPVDRLLPNNLALPPSDEPVAEPEDWTKLVQAFYQTRGRRVTEADVGGIAAEASRLRKTRQTRRLSTDDLIMKAVLECSLKIRPRW